MLVRNSRRRAHVRRREHKAVPQVARHDAGAARRGGRPDRGGRAPLRERHPRREARAARVHLRGARRVRQRPQGLRRRDCGRPHVAARAARGLLRHRARSRRHGPLPEPQGAARAQSRDGDRTVGREARAARKRQDRRRRIRGLESLAVAALRISRSTQPNQDGGPGGERRSGLRKLSFYSPLHAKAFPAHLGSK